MKRGNPPCCNPRIDLGLLAHLGQNQEHLGKTKSCDNNRFEDRFHLKQNLAYKLPRQKIIDNLLEIVETRMMKQVLMFGGLILGIVFLILAFVYFTTPANSLPTFLPGYAADLSTVHYKHAIGSLILGLAAFALAWFQTGKKSSQTQE